MNNTINNNNKIKNIFYFKLNNPHPTLSPFLGVEV